MFCEKCGNPLGDGDKFCEKCGHKIDYNEITERSNTEEKVEPLKEEAQPSSAIVKEEITQKSGKGGKVAAIILTVLVALVVGVLVFFLVSGMSLSDITGKVTGESPTSVSETYETPKPTEERTTEPDIDEDEPEAEETGEYYRVSVGRNNRLSLRALPDEDSTKLDRIDNGTRLYITEVRGNWGRTTYDGESGWVCLRKDGDTYCVKD